MAVCAAATIWLTWGVTNTKARLRTAWPVEVPRAVRPLLLSTCGMKGEHCGPAHSIGPNTTCSGMWGEVLCRKGTAREDCLTGPYYEALAGYQL